MSLVNRGLGFVRTLILRGLGGPTDPDETNNEYNEDIIQIESNVKPKAFFYPLTGTFSENKNVTGWKYSKSIPQDLNNIYRRIENSLGGYLYNLEEGTIRSDWKGAVLEGISLEKIIKRYQKNYSSAWLPNVNTGVYSIYWLEKILYSDYSSSVLLQKEFEEIPILDEDTGDVLDTESVLITEKLLPFGASNISITNFKRDKYFVNIPWLKYRYFDRGLTGIETLPEFWFDVTDSEDQTIVSTNSFYERQIGFEAADLLSHYDDNPNLIELFEFAGLGVDTRSIIYTEYFPIVDVLLIEETKNPDDTSSIEIWNEVPKFTFTGEREFIVDKFNGKILINKTFEKEYYLFKYYAAEKRLQFYSQLDEWLLNSGYIELDGVKVEYYEKAGDSILLKEDLDNPAGFAQGVKIKFLSEGANFTTGTQLWVGYKTIPRIDYEVSSSIRSSNVNLKPYTKVDSSGILEINPYETHISKLTLKSDLTLNARMYETLFMGGAGTRLTATAENTHGAPVKESLVTFYSDFGEFNSDGLSSVAMTNHNGEAYTYFTWPYDEATNHVLITNIEHIGNKTLIKVELDSVSAASTEVNIFQIAKDDPFYGSLGWASKVTDADYADLEYVILTLSDNLPNLEEYFSNQMLYLEYDALSSQEDFDDFVSTHNCQDLLINYCLGFIKIGNSNWKFIVDKIISKNKIAVKKEYFSNLNTVLNTIGNKIQLYKRNETVFDPEKVQRGFSYDRIMYTDNGSKLEPIRPSNIIRDTDSVIVIYDGILLPPPNLYNPKTLIAGYKIFLNRIAKVYAEVTDPATGRIVKSNTIKILVSLPYYLKGQDGFKIMTEANDNESGLGGSNFITINEIEAENNFNDMITELITINPFYKNRINFFINNEA
jgi:hypothetical protein